jgi:transposase-like protein
MVKRKLLPLVIKRGVVREERGGGVGEGKLAGLESVGALAGEAMPRQQQIAMEKLASGETIVDAAQAAGVTRMTLHRWLKQDARFAAAYNAWQQEAVATARGRLLALSDQAVTTVANSVKAGDTRAALLVLKAMGAMDRPTPGPTDPEGVLREQELERKRIERQQFSDSLEF